jgi:AGZA family xanthine/uracil permease-like MFS transporter
VHPPVPVDADFWSFLFSAKGWTYMAVIFPMGLFNLIGSLQNLESAEAAGDTYSTRSSLLANGVFSLLAAGFGSAFPTTIYIGHPAWKSMGARIGYSLVNGVVIALLCLLGMITLVIQYVPLEVTLGILLWIGIIMTAQAYQEVPKAHALAVSLGLIPALAAWALVLVETSLRVAGTTLAASVAKFGNQLYIDGVIALSQGFLLSSMVLASIMVYLLEQNFGRAALWTLGAAVLSQIGLIHAYEMGEVGVINSFGIWQAPAFTLAYFAAALVMLYFARLKPRPQPAANTSWRLRGRGPS